MPKRSAQEIDFDGRVAIVTGAGGGLGRCYALELARRGCAVIVNDPGGTTDGQGYDEAPATQVVREITDAGGRAVADFNPVGTPAAARAILDHALDAFRRVDILINNAGILLPTRPLAETSPQGIEDLLRVHLTGPIHLARVVVTTMLGQGYGRIINTASPASYGLAGQVAYSAAKTGIIGFTRSLALEVSNRCVAVNAVSPLANTRMATSGVVAGLTASATPEAIAPLVVYLAHISCRVTGQVFTASSGRFAVMTLAETPGFIPQSSSPEQVGRDLRRITYTGHLATPADIAEATELISGHVNHDWLSLRRP